MTLELSLHDKAMLAGDEGKAKQIAMRIIIRMAEIQGAHSLIDITQAHIDGCGYRGEASLKFAENLAELGGKVSVPTTLNAISVDKRKWQLQGVDERFADKANRLADAYLTMGAEPSFTCAPYHLAGKPKFGEHITWAESNAVAYANSVLGARTSRYPDFMDICAALTGRTPFSGYHLDENRSADVYIELPEFDHLNESFFPLLGYVVGSKVHSDVPVIDGLKGRVTADDLKAFGAGAATSGAVGMFHIAGVTPEAPTVDEALGGKAPKKHLKISNEDLYSAWKSMHTSKSSRIDMVALGSPHFSIEECRALAAVCENRKCSEGLSFLITTSRYVYRQAEKEGLTDIIESFGAEFITDTCWCMIQTPVIPEAVETIMTNSAKYAHYAPGLVGRDIYFGSVPDCVNSAVTGRAEVKKPSWLK